MSAVAIEDVRGLTAGVPAALDALSEKRGSTVSPEESSALTHMLAGTDAVFFVSEQEASREVYGIALERSSGSSLVLCASREAALEIGAVFCSLGLRASIAHSGEVFAGSLEGIVIAPMSAAMAACGDALASHAFDRCVIDNVDLIVRQESLSDIEAVLSNVREVRKEAQLVLIGEERSPNLTALSGRFLKNPQTCPT